MRGEEMTLDNCYREVVVLGLRLTWWRRAVWRDGFFQPPYFEARTRTGRGFIVRMGRFHPDGPVDPKASGSAGSAQRVGGDFDCCAGVGCSWGADR